MLGAPPRPHVSAKIGLRGAARSPYKRPVSARSTVINRSTKYFAATAVVLYGLLVAFQIALVAGAPWGRAAYGGFVEQPGLELRATSVVAAIVWSGAALVILKRAGFAIWAPLPRRALPAAVWALGVVCLLAIVANAMTPSELERAIWLPFATGMAVTTFGVAISARRREAESA